MKQTFQFAAAIVGIIVGAGFASGQEILQFFTSFGWIGTLGSIVATLLFAFLFMQVMKLGYELKATSHVEVLHHICGKTLGSIVDWIITFFLFGVLAVMFAGSGSLFEQQFNLPNYVGNIFMVIITVFTVCLNIKKIINIIGFFTPILFIMILVICGYSLFTMELNFSELSELISNETAATSNWLLSAALYVSYCIAAGFSMITVMGGTGKNSKETRMGGILGGAILGLLVILFHFSMFTQLDQLQNVDMPTLILASNLAPWFALIMAILILGMIYNTAVGMLYSFTVRFIKSNHPKFKVYTIGISILAFLASFVGFTNLVGTLYPITGYLGFILIGVLIFSSLRKKRNPVNKEIIENQYAFSKNK